MTESLAEVGGLAIDRELHGNEVILCGARADGRSESEVDLSCCQDLVAGEEAYVAQLLEKRPRHGGGEAFTPLSEDRVVEISGKTFINLAISDLVMSAISGRQLVERIGEMCEEQDIPRIPFILLTARRRQIRNDDMMVRGRLDIITCRPFDFATLVKGGGVLIKPEADNESGR